jgi:hypothetical protein
MVKVLEIMLAIIRKKSPKVELSSQCEKENLLAGFRIKIQIILYEIMQNLFTGSFRNQSKQNRPRPSAL